jgi:hypothetical protein
MRRSELSLPHWYKCSGIRGAHHVLFMDEDMENYTCTILSS